MIDLSQTSGQRDELSPGQPVEHLLVLGHEGDQAKFLAIRQCANRQQRREFRVALLSPTSATHGVSFGQRYVKLKVIQTDIPSANGVSTLTIQAPLVGQVPPGWYMLAVVNSAGVPADAKWIQFVQQ